MTGLARRRAGLSARLTSDDRQIATLAIPALGALAAEPLYVLVDTAIVGHLGVSPLAALALAGTVLSAVVALCNFLAYGSTPKVGRLYATGQARAAAALGMQAIILAVVLGLGLAVLAVVLAVPVLSIMGGHGRVGGLAVRYLRIAALGLPFALLAVAAQGYLRGVSRLLLPLVILLAGNVLNVLLELLFVYGFRWGIAGSAWATVIAQSIMAAGFLLVIIPNAGRIGVQWAALRSLAQTGGEIFVRTGSLFAAFLVAAAILARIGTASLAAHQIAFELWSFLALVLDALAIAAQVLVSHQLGVGDDARARELAVRTLVWSVLLGLVVGAVVLALSDPLPRAFTSDPRVLNRAAAIWPIFALMQPINGAVFALDGILIGAGDTRFLMWAMIPCSLLAFVPLEVVSLPAGWGIVGVWCGLLAFVLARLVATGIRFAGDRWIRVGAGDPAVAA